jgi:hypothetical protein
LAGDNWPGVCALEIAEPTEFQTYVAYRRDATLSTHGLRFVTSLRAHMECLAAHRTAPPDRRARVRTARAKK